MSNPEAPVSYNEFEWMEQRVVPTWASPSVATTEGLLIGYGPRRLDELIAADQIHPVGLVDSFVYKNDPSGIMNSIASFRRVKVGNDIVSKELSEKADKQEVFGLFITIKYQNDPSQDYNNVIYLEDVSITSQSITTIEGSSLLFDVFEMKCGRGLPVIIKKENNNLKITKI
jgi:hypothetical protein